MMHRIFSQAELVYADFGDSGDEEARLIEMLHPFTAVAVRYYELALENGISEAYETLRQLLPMPGLHHLGWNTPARFVTRPYFRRLWVLQEYVLARDVTVLVGEHRLSSNFMDTIFFATQALRLQLTQRCMSLDFRGNDTNNVLELVTALPSVNAALLVQSEFVQSRHEQMVHDSQSHTFAANLSRNANFEVKDPRDKFYAILGLSQDLSPVSFGISYLEDIQEVAQRATLLLIEKEQAAFALSRCCGVSSGHDPSWAYSWIHSEDSLLLHVEVDGSCTYYGACGPGGPDLRTTLDRNVLSTKALLLGEIVMMAGKNEVYAVDWVVQNNFSQYIYAALEWLLDISRWIDIVSSSDIPHPAPREFWRAAAADRDTWKQSFKPTRTCLCPHFEESLLTFIDGLKSLRGLVETQPVFDDHGKALLDLVERLDVLNEHDDDFSLWAVIFEKLLHMLPSFSNNSTGRRLAITKDGLLCLVPNASLPGDQLAIIGGMPIPFLLRPKGDRFAIVGLCYIHDMMDGQAFDDGKYPIEDILIC